MSGLWVFSGLRYFFNTEIASGFLCQPSSMNGTRSGHALAVILMLESNLWIS